MQKRGAREKEKEGRRTGLDYWLCKKRKQTGECLGQMRKGPNLFSGRPSTPPPAKRLTTVWPSSYNPYYPKRTERPPQPSEGRVEKPEQKLRGGESTGEACILSPGPPCFPISSLIIAAALLSALFVRVLASFDLAYSCFSGTNLVQEIRRK